MKYRLLVPMLLTIFIAIQGSLFAAEDAPPFETYKIILDRNIFDSTRSPRPDPRERRQEEVRPDRIRLIGVFINGRESVAFFEGSRSEFNTNVRLRKKIAGLELAEINTTKIKLLRNGKFIELPVNSQIERLGDKDWTISSSTAPIAAATTRTNSSPEETTTTNTEKTTEAPPAAENASSDLIKRLMERRKKEMGQ